jgi:hypothetical protein
MKKIICLLIGCFVFSLQSFFVGNMKMICTMIASFLLMLQSFLMPVVAQAAYTSLVTAGDFTAISADVSTAVTGIISVALIILGASLLMKAFGR